MSDIYNSYYQDAEPDRFIKGSTPDSLRLELGLSLEQMLEQALRERLTVDSGRPGEFIEPEHGIIFSPDLIIFNHVMRVGEIKLTWMSSREVPREECVSNAFPQKFNKYISQMVLYCRCLETPYSSRLAFFVNGDYSFMRKGGRKSAPAGPELLAWDFEFTRREMDEEWDTMMAHGLQKRIIV